MASRKLRLEQEVARMRAVRDSLRGEPCRKETNICHPENGDCLRCAAANGEACRK